MRLPALVLAATAAAAIAAPADSQGVIVTHSLSLAMAQKIVDVAIDQCRKLGFHTTISVIDAAGQLKAFGRDDGTAPHTVELSRQKAYTAVTLAGRFPTTLAFADSTHSTLGSAASNIPGTVGIGGGVPIRYHDEVIGGVGSSGAVGGDKDEVCAKAGIDAVADQLK
jgi:uncharacterized protein GlcG (DUF336 family)